MSRAMDGVSPRGLVHYVITQHGIVERHCHPQVQQGRTAIEIFPLSFQHRINEAHERTQRRQRPPAVEIEAAR